MMSGVMMDRMRQNMTSLRKHNQRAPGLSEYDRKRSLQTLTQRMFPEANAPGSNIKMSVSSAPQPRQKTLNTPTNMAGAKSIPKSTLG